MEESKVIEMLIKQNERLMQIIETFASKEHHINNEITNVINSNNGSNAEAVGTQTDIEKAKNVNTGTANEIGDKTNRL